MSISFITATQATQRVANSSAFNDAVQFIDIRIKEKADLGLTSYSYDKLAHQLSAEKITQLKKFLTDYGFVVTEPSSAVILISWPSE